MQRWLIDAAWKDRTRAQFAPIFAFAVAQRGQYETFQIVPPEVAKPLGVATGTPVVSGVHLNGRTIATTGWTASTTGIMKAMDFIKFSGHAKVYMVVADASSDVSGNATLTIEPALMDSLSAGEGITVTDVPFTVAFVGDVQEYAARPPLLFDYQAKFIEVP